MNPRVVGRQMVAAALTLTLTTWGPPVVKTGRVFRQDLANVSV